MLPDIVRSRILSTDAWREGIQILEDWCRRHGLLKAAHLYSLYGTLGDEYLGALAEAWPEVLDILLPGLAKLPPILTILDTRFGLVSHLSVVYMNHCTIRLLDGLPWEFEGAELEWLEWGPALSDAGIHRVRIIDREPVLAGETYRWLVGDHGPGSRGTAMALDRRIFRCLGGANVFMRSNFALDALDLAAMKYGREEAIKRRRNPW